MRIDRVVSLNRASGCYRRLTTVLGQKVDPGFEALVDQVHLLDVWPPEVKEKTELVRSVQAVTMESVVGRPSKRLRLAFQASEETVPLGPFQQEGVIHDLLEWPIPITDSPITQMAFAGFGV